jgi:hypothetical protein
MSFQTLKKDELLEIAEYFGAEVVTGSTKEQIIAAIVEVGGTWADYKRLSESDPYAPEVGDTVVVDDEPVAAVEEAPQVAPKKKLLLKMTRPNASYATRGYKFTRKHPYALVTEGEDANFFLEQLTGFRLANPNEVKSYYS